jgi:hypothetical protein
MSGKSEKIKGDEKSSLLSKITLFPPSKNNTPKENPNEPPQINPSRKSSKYGSLG